MKLPGTIFKRGDGASAQKAPATASADQGAASTPGGPATPPAHTCPNCKAPMADDQDWCVQCGENDEHSLRARASWYSAGALVAASAILASGAAAAGVAALNQGSDKEPPHTPLVAQVPNNSVVTTTSAAPVNPGTPETLKTPHESTSTAPLLTATSSSHTATPAPAPSSSNSETSSSRTESTTTTTSKAPEPIELQAQDLSVYNPGKTYPPTAIGDPRKSFEEGATTLWSVQVQPPSATELNVGLLVHLSTAQPVATLEVLTSTPGYTLEVLGTKASKPPSAITATAWKPLGVDKKLKRKATLQLAHSSERFNYIVLWIRKLPSSSTPLDHVTIDEVALFPSGSSGS